MAAAAGRGPPDPGDSTSRSCKAQPTSSDHCLLSLDPRRSCREPLAPPRAPRGTDEAPAVETGLHGLGGSHKMNVGNLFQDVNVSELMKKLDILGDNGVTMPAGFCARALVSTWVCPVCLSFLFGSGSSQRKRSDTRSVRLLCGRALVGGGRVTLSRAGRAVAGGSRVHGRGTRSRAGRAVTGRLLDAALPLHLPAMRAHEGAPGGTVDRWDPSRFLRSERGIPAPLRDWLETGPICQRPGPR